MCDVCRERESQGCPTCGAAPGERCVDRNGNRKKGCGHAGRGSGRFYRLPGPAPESQAERNVAAGLDSFRAAAAERTREAARRDVTVAAEALRAAPPDWPPMWLAVAQARRQLPSASWREVGESIGITKDAAVGIFRRLREEIAGPACEPCGTGWPG